MQKLLCSIFFLLFSLAKLAAAPASYTVDVYAAEKNISATDYKKENYKKKSLKQRAAVFFIRTLTKFAGKKTYAAPGDADKIEKKALWAKWLGIGSLIGLLIPGINLLSLPAAIVAIAFGAQTIKKTKHPGYARQGIIFGSITAGLLLLTGFIVALVTLLPVG